MEPIHTVDEHPDPGVMALGVQAQFVAQVRGFLVLAAEVTVDGYVRRDKDVSVYETTQGAKEIESGNPRHDSLSASVT